MKGIIIQRSIFVRARVIIRLLLWRARKVSIVRLSPPLYPDSWTHPGATRANNGTTTVDKLPSKTTGRKRNKTMDNRDDVLTRRLAYFRQAGEKGVETA